MHAMVMHETGGPEVLVYEEAERPEAGDGEVLIRVRAVAVNPIDSKRRRELPDDELPAVLGNDVSGTVEVSRAEAFAQADEVFGIAASGGYAEFAATPTAVIAKKPLDVNLEQASAISVSATTTRLAHFDRGWLYRGHT